MFKSSEKDDARVGNTRAKASKTRYKERLSTPQPLLALNHKFQPKKIEFIQPKNSTKKSVEMKTKST